MQAWGAWRPDTFGLNSGYAGEALGVLPAAASYIPWPGLESLGQALATGACRGAKIARLADGSITVYAGTATRLYKWAGAGSAWTNATRASGGDYALNADECWSMDQFGTKLIAVARGNAPQYIDVDSGTQFDALAGSPPQAAYVKTVGDYVLLGDLSTGRTRVRWSGFRDSTFWTTGLRNCDEREFNGVGFVTGFTAIEAGLIFTQSATFRFQPVTNVATFATPRIQDAHGCACPYSIVTHAGSAYYLSDDGFNQTNASGQVVNIGAEKASQWFLDNVNRGRMLQVIGALDPLRQRIFWLFASGSNVTYYLDQIVCYDILLGEFTHATTAASYILPAALPATTVSDLDSLYTSIDLYPFSLDSPLLQGGRPGLAAFDNANKLAFFSGQNMAATVQTAEFQPIPGRRFYVNGCRPINDSADATMRLYVKERPQDTIVSVATGSINAQGMVPLRGSGRYARLEMTIPAEESWEHTQGVDFADDDLVDDGER